MKPSDAKSSFEQLKKDLRAKEFKQIYLFYGEELYLIKYYLDRLLTALGGEIGDMNTNVFEGKDVSVGQIIDQAETMPFLAERRVILLRDTGLAKAGSDQLAEYLENPCESTVFLLWEKDVDERCKLVNVIKKQGMLVCIQKQDQSYLQTFIGGYLKKEGKMIAGTTANYLLEKTGPDMVNLASELEKLVAYTLDKNEITEEDVDAICSQTTEDRVFQMIDRILEKNRREALEMYYDLLALKVPPVKILVLLERRYMQLLQVKSLREQGEVENNIQQRMKGLRPFQVRTLIRHAGMMTREEIRRGLELCGDIDESFKSGRIDEGIGVEMAILNLLDRTTA